MTRFVARSFRDLIVWQKAHHFVLEIYRYTRRFPKEEIYSLSSQFRRAAVSTPANIAEGFKERSRSDKARFMNISQGSLRFPGRMSLLSYSGGGPWLWRQSPFDVPARGGQ